MPDSPFHGVFPPLATPRERGRPDVEAFAENLQAYLEWPLAGVLVGGSSGEAALLTPDELDRQIVVARDAMPSDRRLIVGVRGESTETAIRTTLDAEARGADATLLLPPHFHPLPDDSLVAHFEAVADAADRPVLVYHVPKFTGRTLSRGVLERLATHPRIGGVKESTTDRTRLVETCGLASASFAVLCGHAPWLSTALLHGAAGAVLAMADAVPDLCLAVMAAFASGDGDDVRRLQEALDELSRRILGAHGIAGLKRAMEIRGLRGGPPAAPLPPLGDEGRTQVRDALDAAVANGALARLRLRDARRPAADGI